MSINKCIFYNVVAVYLLMMFDAHAEDVVLCKDEINIVNSGTYKIGASCHANSLNVRSSNVIMDCNGAVFNNKKGSGVIIIGKGIGNVEIKNCEIKNSFGHGVWITSGIRINEYSHNIAENYSNSPSNIRIENVSIINSRMVGIYIDSYSENVSVVNSSIDGSGGVGIYLEQASKRNYVVGSTISNNGWANKNNLREGVAIDSSLGNTLEKNVIKDNGAGGVFLYKNCGEHYDSGNSVIRWQHADDNKITSNFFESQKYGVWVASRQTRDLSKWGCGDESVDSNGKYYPDYANHNTIADNVFCHVEFPIRNEGSLNYFINNKMDNEIINGIMDKFQDVKSKTGIAIHGNVYEKNHYSPCM